MIKNIWEGVYSSFSDCPVVGKGHSGDIWSGRSKDKLNRLMLDHSAIPTQNESSLAQLVGLLDKDDVSIFDVGGNLGLSYIHLKKACCKSVNYHVLEVPEICTLGKELFKDHDDVRFYDSIPEHLNKIDILYLSNSLQYIDDWKDFIAKLMCFNPDYIVLANLFAGSIQTYATVQNYYDSKIPSWFFNYTEIVETADKLGYKLILKTAYKGEFLGVYQDVPQDNFPEECRLHKMCTLLFKRKV
jgi:putative methyltransferase (TIGR04325 family)